MRARCCLVYFPGSPFLLDNLLPKRALALTAALMREAGGEVAVCDFGTTDFVTRLVPPILRDIDFNAAPAPETRSAGPWRSIQTAWRTRALTREWARVRGLALRNASERIALLDVSSIAFYTETAQDIAAASALAAVLQSRRPSTRMGLFGPHVGSQPVSPFDWATSSIEHTAALTVGKYGSNTHEWAHLEETMPLFDASVYSAMGDGRKFWIFQTTVDDAASAVANQRWVREARYLESHVGANALLVECGRPDASVGRSRMAAGFGCVAPFVRDSSAHGLPSAESSELVTLEVHSGSQRMLDRYHRAGMLVSAIEGEIRELRQRGVYTVARLDFPADGDDYHTASETLRMMIRSRPDAAVVRVPFVMPQPDCGSGWRSGVHSALDHGRPTEAGLPSPDCRLGRGLWGGTMILGHDRERSALSLCQELEDQGILTNLTEPFILAARVSGYAGREAEYADLLALTLLQGDSSGLADLARLFQRSARSRALCGYTAAFAERRAVGN